MAEKNRLTICATVLEHLKSIGRILNGGLSHTLLQVFTTKKNQPKMCAIHCCTNFGHTLEEHWQDFQWWPPPPHNGQVGTKAAG